MALEKVTDHQIQELLDGGVSQSQIARLCHVNEGTISRRVKAIRKQSQVAASSSEVATRALNSMWDTKGAAEENFRRCLLLIDECEGATEKTRLLGEIRQHIQFGVQVIATLYAAQEQQAFMDEVMNVLDECEPGTRARMLARLSERRSVRAAFFTS